MIIRAFRGFELSNKDPLAPSQFGEWGAGTYFTSSRECAENYSDEVVIECSINLENPLSATAEYDETLIEEVDYESASLGFVSALFKEKLDINELINHARESNDLGLFGCEINNEVAERGYDGIIARWKDGSEHVVCYRPESIINVENIYVRGKPLCNEVYTDFLPTISAQSK